LEQYTGIINEDTLKTAKRKEHYQATHEIEEEKKPSNFKCSFTNFISHFFEEIVDWKKPFILSFNEEGKEGEEENIMNDGNQKNILQNQRNDVNYDNHSSNFIQHLIDAYGDSPVDYYPHGLQEVGNSPIFFGLKEAALQLLRTPKRKNSHPEKDFTDNETQQNRHNFNFMHNLYNYQLDPLLYDISHKGSYIQWNLEQHIYIDLLNYIFPNDQLNSTKNQNMSDKQQFAKPTFHEFLSKHADNWLHYCFPVRNLFNTDKLVNSFEKHLNLKPFEPLMKNGNGNKNLVNDFGLGSHWWMLLIGEEDAGMFIHTDTLRTSSWQYQIEGVKEWRLCSPRDFNNSLNLPSIHSGKAGFLDAFEYYDKQRSGHKIQKISQKDTGLGAFENVTCYGANLLPNQLLYYPRDYWHQTKCRSTPSIALSGSILDPLLGISLKNEKDEISTSATLTQKKKKKNKKKRLEFGLSGINERM